MKGSVYPFGNFTELSTCGRSNSTLPYMHVAYGVSLSRILYMYKESVQPCRSPVSQLALHSEGHCSDW